jgi:hypothetical protein
MDLRGMRLERQALRAAREAMDAQAEHEARERDNQPISKPWPTYDRMTADEVVTFTLEGGFDRATVCEYELANAHRDAVVDALYDSTEDAGGRVTAVVRA